MTRSLDHPGADEMTTASPSLIELLINLLRDPAALEEFRDDPHGFLACCGDVSAEDVRDAIAEIRDRSDGGNHVHLPPPPAPYKNDGESDDDATIRYINNYYTEIDDRDTYVDNSIHQEVDTGGGIFEQNLDVDSQVLSGDGAIGAGGDINDARIATGDDNTVGNETSVVGPGNVAGEHTQAVTGDRDNTAFGQGDAETGDVDGDVRVGTDGGFAAGGESTVGSYNDESDQGVDNSYSESEYTDNSTYNEDTRTTTETDNSVSDPYV
jgi:hypothetical protein